MFLVNAAYLDQDFRLVRGDLEDRGEGRIRQVGEKLSWSQNDLVVELPGLHQSFPALWTCTSTAAPGADTCDGKRESIDAMAGISPDQGPSPPSAPTTMTVGPGGD